MHPNRWERGVFAPRRAGKDSPTPMRTMYVLWLTLIATGLVLYTVIGLAHN